MCNNQDSSPSPSEALFDISGRVIVVTGATGALAGEAARHLLAHGARVVMLSRNPDNVAASLEAGRKISDEVMGVPCDVLDEAGLRETAGKILERFGSIDGLVNGAGGNQPGATIGPDKTIFDLELDAYEKVIDLNLKGTLLPSLVFGKVMAEREKGSIVNFSSMASPLAITRVVGYSNAKAAVDNLTRWMAMDFARKFGDGIRVNAVAPGFFLGKQNARLLTNEDGSLTERGRKIIENTPMARFGESIEVCGAIHYLLSPAAQFVTGQVLAIDGGFSTYSGV